MVPVQALVNAVLKKSFTEDIQVTPMKLQKLLYFIYRDYLQKQNHPLLSESFLAWDHGPVLSSVYYEFKTFSADPITRFFRDAAGNASIVSESAVDIIASIDFVWSRFKHHTGPELSVFTHQPGTAWTTARASGNTTLLNEDILNEPNC